MSKPTLLSLNNYHYHRGGAEAVFLGHNRIFSERGWRVVPFSMHHPMNEESEWSDYFVDEIELGHHYSLTEKIEKATKTIYSFEARRKISALIDATEPTICHAHNIYHHISPSVLSEVRKRGVPVVMTLHDLKIVCPAYKMLNSKGICEDCKGGKIFSVVRNKCIRDSRLLSTLVYLEAKVHRLLRTYENHVDAFVVPSRFFQRKLIEWGIRPSKLRWAPNFLDVSALKHPLDHQSPETTNSKTFIYVGRLAREKGIHALVKAAASTGLPLRIVGTGPDEEALKAHAEALGAGNISFEGFLSGDELHQMIALSSAMVLPSEWYENAPISVLEAFGLGKPVIASHIGGLPELVQDGKTGFTFQAGSVESLAAALVEFNGRSQREIDQMGAAAREYVVSEHNPSTYYKRVLDVYREYGVDRASHR